MNDQSLEINHIEILFDIGIRNTEFCLVFKSVLSKLRQSRSNAQTTQRLRVTQSAMERCMLGITTRAREK